LSEKLTNKCPSKEGTQPCSGFEMDAKSSSDFEAVREKQKVSKPWKKKNPPKVISKPSNESSEMTNPGGFKTDAPSTFSGQNGGSAEDAELLAELKKVSTASSSVDRFAGSNEDDDDQGQDKYSQSLQPAAEIEKPVKKQSAFKPWKKKKSSKASAKSTESTNNLSSVNETNDARPSSPPLPTGRTSPGGFQPSSNFTGKNGGSAEDEELLAELRKISSASGSVDRFSIVDDDEEEMADKYSIVKSQSANQASKPRKAKQISGELLKMSPDTKEISSLSDTRASSPPIKSAVNFHSNSTFTGKNGGSAEDEELLAELRNVSNASSSADRFKGSDNAEENGDKYNSLEEPVPKKSQKAILSKKGKGSVPPWKRKKKKKSSESETKILDNHNEPTGRSSPGGFKMDIPSTFNGERGGSAEDADLLAELKRISTKSSSSNRFADDSTENLESEASISDDDKYAAKPSSTIVQKKLNQPKKRVVPKKPIQDSMKASENQNPCGFRSQPSTFTGERGGAAEDAELLAELKRISTGSGSSTNRFANGEDKTDANSSNDVAQPVGIRASNSGGKGSGGNLNESTVRKSSIAENTGKQSASSAFTGSSTTGGIVPSDVAAEPTVTEAELPESISDKNWKIRKISYELLDSMILKKVGNKKNCSIESETVIESLDSVIPIMVKDSNAGALDAALVCANSYAEYCTGATSAHQAQKNAKVLVKGNALSSSRPSTTKNANSLVLKLMEVGSDGSQSLHLVTEILLTEGTTSRKPKLVSNSANLVLEAAHAFGAPSLPLGILSTGIPKMLAHINPGVRDTALNIIAAVCVAVGSKDPLQKQIDDMKSAQKTQFEELYKKSTLQPPKIGLRSQRIAGSNSPPSLISPEEALAALKTSKKEDEAKRFASRKDVNIFQGIGKTDYSAKIQLPKWSEVVGALNILLELGGEKPYKLAQPSSTVNYNALVSDLRKKLSHTHFAVNSKAMEVLSMFAVGVGEKMYPQLRPLLLPLTDLLKDKKLTVAASNCLDCFFGNVLSFDHLLDKDDSLSIAVNEKKAKECPSSKIYFGFLEEMH